MADVCVSRNLDLTAGKLGVEPWSVFRLVADVTGTSTGDGALTRNTRLPGKLMINTSVSWVSNSPLPSQMMLRVTRAHRSIVSSNPNAVQMRDAWEVGIDEAPRTPDPSRVLNSQFGTAADLGVDTTAQPYYGRIYLHADTTSSDTWFDDPLPAGSTITIAYRCYVWTPPPWSNNASANQPVHEAYARSTRLQLFAAPLQDEALR
ncbi:hypothetical protein NDR87_26340 [Nocardia sp. CDC159]|uniref:DUF7172 domain-containing protein n=1 Tax=Nocardia pulmonis TaxID=2951408 RepID=A0A9X2IWI8_9NOCA|nr:MULTISPECIES: hypothetical protein [Nocardia]MCM6774967.1 hypothetical protein [Nocardia pulmonis]MCM6789898.1 hypothetical protein [Nocardia sp. CDC159]